jgi:hypothetical protein
MERHLLADPRNHLSNDPKHLAVEDLRTPLSLTAIDGLDRLLAAMQALPTGVHTAALAALVAGLVLWMFGNRVMKPVFAVVGVCLGALLGAVALPASGVTSVGGWHSVYVGMLAGAVAGCVVACLLFRFALAACSGVVFAALGLLGSSVYLNHQTPQTVGPPMRLLLAPMPEHEPDPDADTVSRIAAESLVGAGVDPAIAGAALSSETVEKIRPKIEEQAERAQQFAQEMGRRWGEAWASVEPGTRMIMLGACVVGGVVGVLFGLLMPKRSAAVVTSLAGSAIALMSIVWLAGAFEAPGRSVFEQPPQGMVVIWVIASLVGMIIQMSLLNKARKSGA